MQRMRMIKNILNAQVIDSQEQLLGALRMQGIEVSGAFVDGKPLSAAFCGGVALSTYTKNGSKWVFGGEYLQRNYTYDEDMTIPVAQFTAEGGYYQKLLTDASKTLFIYGGALTLNIEVYLSDRLALLGNVRERCLWGNDTGHFHTQYGAGLKLIIN